MRKRTMTLYVFLALALVVGSISAAIYLYVNERMGKLPGPDEVAKFEKLPNFRDGVFVNEEPAVLLAGKKDLTKILLGFVGKSVNAPKKPIESVSLKNTSFAPVPDDFTVIWLGHSAMIFEMDQKRFITDPVFGNASPLPFTVCRYGKCPLKRRHMPSLDFVLITHDHYDHLEYDTIRKLRKSGTTFVTPLGVGARLRGWGVKADKIIELNWGESTEIGGLKITAQPARHFSGRSPSDRDKTLWASYVVEGSDKKIFIGGDSGYGRHFKSIGDKYGPFDLVCLEIDAWNPRWPNNHMFVAEVAEAFKDLKGKKLLPVHWGVFDLALHPWDESIEMMKKVAAEENIPIVTPKMGERKNISAEPTQVDN